VLDIGYIQEQNSFGHGQELAETRFTVGWYWGRPFGGREISLCGLEETGIDDTDFRILEALLNKGPLPVIRLAEGEPYPWIDQRGR